MSNLLKKDRGFTLIEVVIVLAIGALLIMVVLQAVTSANQSSRDSTRKQEVGRMVSLLETAASNNGGQYPTTANFLSTTAPGIGAYDATLAGKYSNVTSCPSPV